MKAGTARNERPPQAGAEVHPLRRAAGMIILFNALLVAWVLLKPGSDRMLAAVVNSAEFVGPLLALPLCFGGLLRPMWRRRDSQTDVGPEVTIGQRWASFAGFWGRRSSRITSGRCASRHRCPPSPISPISAYTLSSC